MKKKKRVIQEYLNQRTTDFTALSDQIWSFAELSLQEYKSAAAYIDFLKQEGFTVQENLSGIETAFSGSFGSGKPVIGILGEYDALSSLSQKAGVTVCDPEVPDGSGHGCGHNLLGVGSLAAAVAIKHLIESGELSGTVIFYGCPGEEGCASKAFMARDGIFRELDAALSWHPSDVNGVTTGSNMACLQMEYTFHGIAAHAAGNPDKGRSALDAVSLMNIGVQFLREHIPHTDCLHYSILDAGGISPNVVQPTAKVLYMLRSDTVRHARKLLDRVRKIANGAAMMTETTVKEVQIDGTSNVLSNRVLEQLLDRNLREARLPEYSEEEENFAEALYQTFDHEGIPGDMPEWSTEVRRLVSDWSDGGTKPLNDFVLPYVPTKRMEPGSSDVGDVSWLTPTAQFTAASWVSGTPGHSWQAVSVGKTPIAHKGMMLAANVLAGAVMDLMESPELVAAAQAEFHLSAREGYDCPLHPSLKPCPAL